MFIKPAPTPSSHLTKLMRTPQYFFAPSPCLLVPSYPGILSKALVFHSGKANWKGSLEGKALARVEGYGSSRAPVWSVSGTNVVSGAGGLRRWKPLAATRPRQERLVVGAGVGDEAQELHRLSVSTHVEERQSSPWALEALCGHGNSRVPECPGPAEHIRDHPGKGPNPDYRDDTRSAFPS